MDGNYSCVHMMEKQGRKTLVKILNPRHKIPAIYIFFNFIRWQYCAGLSEQKAKRSASVYSEVMQLFK